MSKVRTKRKIKKEELSDFIVNEKNIDEVLSKLSKSTPAGDEPQFIVIDLFCGAGGTSTGFLQAILNDKRIAKVIACVNHDFTAIKSHWRNNPDVLHFEEDIRTLNVDVIEKILDYYKEIYPDAFVILWASLECTNFSKAKGGQPRDADSRTLAESLYKYVEILNPDYIQIENVVEFMSWGPLDDNGKPVSRKNGQDWLRWRNQICSFGYHDEWKEMNSANFGAYTSRNRLFGCFAKDDLPIVWPEPTHAKNPSKHSMYGDLKKWKAVKEVLNFEDEGESIFNRKKDLSDKTLERVYAGLIKYVANGDTSFIQKYYSGRPAGKVSSTDQPAGTITTVANQTLVQADFLLKYNSTNGKTGKHIPPSIEDPAPVVSCQGRLGLVQPEFLANYYGQGGQLSSIENPCPVIPTKDRISLIQTKFFIDKHFGKYAQNQSIHQPAGTILPNDKHRLVEVSPFIMPTNYDNKPKSIDEPLQTITANRKHHYLINPSWGGNPGSVEDPCCVIVARQDKAPLYFVQVERGNVAIAVFDGDSEIMIKIKQFMAVYGIVDIKMRMLRILELLRIQGFPKKYKLEGNQSEQKKFIGNSVVPQVVKCWIEALGQKLIDYLKTKAA